MEQIHSLGKTWLRRHFRVLSGTLDSLPQKEWCVFPPDLLRWLILVLTHHSLRPDTHPLSPLWLVQETPIHSSTLSSCVTTPESLLRHTQGRVNNTDSPRCLVSFFLGWNYQHLPLLLG